MALIRLKPRKALNKAFLKVKPNRTDIELFKFQLTRLIDRSNDTESEEFHKNLIIDFLKKTYYDPHHYINTKGRNDLVIHNGEKAGSSVGVIIEVKKPTNKSEMIRPAAGRDSGEKMNTMINVKAFQELVLYYLRERITQENLEIRHLIITNIYEWYIFDATLFDRLFAQNKKLVRQFKDFESGRLADTRTDFFYHQIAEPFIAGLTADLEYTHFIIREYDVILRNNDKKDDNKLIALFKLLSPEHLLKLPFTNDSNSLDKNSTANCCTSSDSPKQNKVAKPSFSEIKMGNETPEAYWKMPSSSWTAGIRSAGWTGWHILVPITRSVCSMWVSNWSLPGSTGFCF